MFANFSTSNGALLEQTPEDWGPILDSLGSGYLPYLCANAAAWNAGQSLFDVTIEGAPYRSIRTSSYRVWCLQQIRRHYDELPDNRKAETQDRLEAHDCWDALWQVDLPRRTVSDNARLPFVTVGTQTELSSKLANKILNFLPVRAPTPPS